jgi:cell division protein FtsB
VKLRHLLFPVLLGVAIYYAVFGGEYDLFDVERARSATVVETEALERLRAETEELRLRVDSLETDPSTLERLAREKFGMIRDGEVLYRFATPRQTPPTP